MPNPSLKCIPLNNFGGTGNITINGGEFPPGMYMYALIVDGQVLDTKRMI